VVVWGYFNDFKEKNGETIKKITFLKIKILKTLRYCLDIQIKKILNSLTSRLNGFSFKSKDKNENLNSYRNALLGVASHGIKSEI